MTIKYSNLELYNWEELSQKYNLEAKDQTAFLELFLNKYQTSKIDELKGAYAFVYENNNIYYIYRDIVGIKPICIHHKEELKYSPNLNNLPSEAFEMNPRRYITYNQETNELKEHKRTRYYDIKPNNQTYNKTKDTIRKLFKQAIKRRAKPKIGILFSGGTDSTLIALTLKELGMDFTCYTASLTSGNITEGRDIHYAREIAKEQDFKWKLCELDLDKVEEYTKKIIHIIHSTKYTKVCVALPLFIALEQAKKDNIDYMFSGIGSEEIFADYKRQENIENINEICIEGLKNLWIRDLYRDDMLANANNIKLLYPFLDDDFANYAIKIDDKFKINKDKEINKVILRDILRDMGLSEKMVSRRKKAAQYGSRSDRVYEKICRQKKIKKQEYLEMLNDDIRTKK